jgi:anti-sigma factor RsiW
LHAYFDGELDAPGAAAFESHLGTCEECRAALEGLEGLRSALRTELPHERAPAALAARITAALDLETAGRDRQTAALGRQPASFANPHPEGETIAAPLAARTTPAARTRSAPSFLQGLLTGAAGGLLAAALAFVLIAPPVMSPRGTLLDDLVNAHIRSLLPAHLVDVESTDRHTVKPWFAGHVDVSPAVYDFTAQGYRLLGGRADYFAHQRAAALVYQHGAHVINVFSWAAEGGIPADTTRNGYHLAFWQAGNLRYCAVSDTGWPELLELVSLIRAAEGRENPEGHG